MDTTGARDFLACESLRVLTTIFCSLSAMTIKDFYGKDTPVEEEMVDLASVVKRRRVMAALAAEEKRKRDIEERLRREKEAEELRKQKDKEAFEKEFLVSCQNR